MTCFTTSERSDNGSWCSNAESDNCGYCQSQCQTNCMHYAQCGSCEGSCQSSCQGCESSCESSCQSGAQTNRGPSVPASLTLPKKIRGGETFTIQWGASVDPDGNLREYELRRSLNNGMYQTIYKGLNRSFDDTVPKGTKTVQYLVYATDTYDLQSGVQKSKLIQVMNNAAPMISGSDYNFGAVSKNFDITWAVTDADGDMVDVSVTYEGKTSGSTTETFKQVSLGVSRKMTVHLREFRLGQCVIKIVATDGKGGTNTRIYRFTKINTPPTFNKSDGDLGDKNTAFTFTYQVTDAEGDSVNIVEYLDDTVIRTRSNVRKNTDLSVTIDTEKLKRLTLGKVYTIRIEAEDSNHGTATLTQTFKRANFAPMISGRDVHLGDCDKKVTYTFSVTDLEGDGIDVSVYLDTEEVLVLEQAQSGKDYPVVIDGLRFLKIPYGNHALRIVATDTNGKVSQRVVSFNRVAKRLLIKLKVPIETDAAARKILIVPNWRLAEGAAGKIYACNNGFDKNPAWEDMTAMATAGLDFSFKNTERTADKWGVDVKIEVKRGTAILDSYVYGFGGAFE